MRFRVTASAVIVSIVLCSFVLCAVLFSNAVQNGFTKVEREVQNFLEVGDLGLDITVETVDSTLMKSIEINNVQISTQGNEIATIDSIEISTSLWNVIKAVLGIGNTHLDITIYNPNATINDVTISSLQQLILRVNQKTDTLQNTTTNASDLKFTISLNVSNATIDISYMDFESTVSNINAQAEFGKNFSFDSATINIPYLNALYNALSFNSNISLEDIRASIDKDFVLSASIEKTSYSDKLNRSVYVENLSTIAKYQDETANIALYSQNITAFYDDYKTLIDGATFVFDIGSNIENNNENSIENNKTTNINLAVKGSILAANFEAKNLDISAQMNNIELNTEVGNDTGISVYTNILEIIVQYSKYNIKAQNIDANIDSSLDFSNALGRLSLGKISAKNLDEFTLENITGSNMNLDFSLKEQNIDLRLSSSIFGKSSNELLGTFTSNLNADASLVLNLDNQKEQNGQNIIISNANAMISNFLCAALSKQTTGSLSYSKESGFDASISIQNELNTSILYTNEQRTLDIKLYFDNLVPSSYILLYEKYLSSQDFVQKETSFDGSIAISLDFDNLELIKNQANNLSNLSFSDFLDLTETLVKSGRFSLNIAVHDVNIEKKAYSGAVTYEAKLNGTLFDVNTFAISTGGLRLSFAGNLDYKNFIPDGMLLLQRANDGMELAKLDFTSINGTLLYNFSLTSPLVKDSSIEGTLNWQTAQMITASAVAKSPYIYGQILPFEVTVIKSPFKVLVKSDNLDLEVYLSSQSALSIIGEAKNLAVNATDTLTVGLDVNLNVSYDLLTGAVNSYLDDLIIRVSDLLEFGFSTHFTDKEIEIKEVFFTQGGNKTSFDGSAKISFSNINDLISFDTEKIKAVIDLQETQESNSSNPRTYIKGTITQGSYYLEANLYSFFNITVNLLGSKGNGFHAFGSVFWGSNNANGFTFNSQYKDGTLGFYDAYGQIGNLTLSNIGLTLDFNKMATEISFSFKNVVDRIVDEDPVQSGTITLTGKLETLASGLFSLIAGLESDVSFKLGLSNFHLEDGYSIPDTSMEIKYSKGMISVDGSLVRGSFNINDGYLDLHIDKEFLFGFDAKGYVGKNVDLMVENIFFPLPLIMQFTDFILFGFNKGDITGDVLIKGPIEDPSFYGMLYCQLYEMTLVYVPEQPLIVNSIAINVQGHEFTIPKMPFTGYSNIDGRFLSGFVSYTMDINNYIMTNMEVAVDVESPADIWYPMIISDSSEIEVRGDATGHVVYGISGGRAYLICDALASNTLIDFKIEDKPDWIYLIVEAIDLDLTITTANDVEFCYPEKDSSFINFTLNEGETVKIKHDSQTKKIDTSGTFSFKTGQVYYFQNDFYITEGSLDLSPKKYSSNPNSISFQLNLTAKLKDYDSSGNKIEIYLILQNATLDNISPRFTSTPIMSETDILALLGQTILPSSTFDQSVSVASVASLVAATTDAFTRLGLIESNSNYSVSSLIRNSLGLDIFSLRSSILQNIIIDALPGELSSSKNISLLSRYLDGTSLFAGSYISSGVFAQLSLMLKADRTGKTETSSGYFLSSDLLLDTEFSIDWDNPIGTFTIFTKPQELSPLNILDNIGFGVTKRIQF